MEESGWKSGKGSGKDKKVRGGGRDGQGSWGRGVRGME